MTSARRGKEKCGCGTRRKGRGCDGRGAANFHPHFIQFLWQSIIIITWPSSTVHRSSACTHGIYLSSSPCVHELHTYLLLLYSTNRRCAPQTCELEFLCPRTTATIGKPLLFRFRVVGSFLLSTSFITLRYTLQHPARRQS